MYDGNKDTLSSTSGKPLSSEDILHKTNPTKIHDKSAKEKSEELKREKYVESDVCNDIYTETTKRSDYAFQNSIITKSLTDQLENYMTSRFNGELINPAVQTGADRIVNRLSYKIEVVCIGSNETLEKQLERRRAQNVIR
ncbi:unnamed protein product [Rotaria sp. Silwood2]|nr:unnamed protein product [Rotaria sp. Silwood2]CAF3138479.1 unnamed protein product [Rotaria sp. Silwood2]CAF4461254.1 unnamed protein product [Rotaria sp. Silwood2]